jgi:hypothetical protein
MGFCSAFREVLRDNQFSSIGIVLLSILSSLERLVLAVLQKLQPLDSEIIRETGLKDKSTTDQIMSESHESRQKPQSIEDAGPVEGSISEIHSTAKAGSAASTKTALDDSTKLLNSHSKTRKKKVTGLLDELFEGLI